MNYRSHNRGVSILGILFFCIIVVFTLSYVKVDLRGFVESPETKENVDYVVDTVKTIWEDHLEEPAKFVWNDVFIGLIWQSFITEKP